MTINFQTKSPEPIQYTAVDHVLSFDLVENETTDDSDDYAEVIVRLQDVQPPVLNFSNLTSSNVDSTITANEGIDTFKKVREGDAVTGANIPSSTTVASINNDYSELTLNNAPTSNLSNDSIVVTPQLLDATLARVKLKLSNVNNTDIKLDCSLYTYNGKQNVLKRNDSGTDDLVVGDANTTNTTTRNINAKTFLENLTK